MTLEEVELAKSQLEREGKYPSIEATRRRLGRGSRRDIQRHLHTLAASTPAQPPMPAIAAAATPAPAPDPPTLLAQAAAELHAALAAERRAQREYDGAPRAERARRARAWQQAREAREAAATVLAQRQRARDRLRAEIPAARIDARRTAGERAALEDETRRRLIRARREAQQAREELERMVQDLTAIAGAGAVPADA